MSEINGEAAVNSYSAETKVESLKSDGAVSVMSDAADQEEISLSAKIKQEPKQEPKPEPKKSKPDHESHPVNHETTSHGKASSLDEDFEIDSDFTSRLLATSGGFSSSVRDNILSHPVVLQNRTDTGLAGSMSSESRHVMRKGFDLGLSTPGLRTMYDDRIKELENELEAERNARVKSERKRSDLQKEFEILSERTEESGNMMQTQAELNKKRELEIQKMQRDMEEVQTQSEAHLVSLRKKYQDAVNQMAEQIDHLHRIKQRTEREKNHVVAEAEELRNQVELALKAKSSADKLCKSLESQLNDANNQLTESRRELNDNNSQKHRILSQNAELVRRLEETESELKQMIKNKDTLAHQLEETKGALEDESRVRAKVVGENRNLQTLLEQVRDQLDEEQENRASLQRQLSRLNNDAAIWKQKYESGENNVRLEEVEEMRRKHNTRLQEFELQLEAAIGKAMGLEKARNRAQMDLETVMADLEKQQSLNIQNEKKFRQIEKVLEDWRKKVTDAHIELDSCQKESRANAAEVYKLRAQLEETQEVIETLRRENKHLSDEIHDLTDQVGEGQRQKLETEKLAKRYEAERDELQTTLEEAESALEQEETKLQRCQLDVTAAKEEMERRLQEKDEEFESVRKNHQRALESLQAALESEVRNKNEVLRMKKKLEQDINELEVALDGANRARLEVEKNIKKYQQQIRELQSMLEEEQAGRGETRDHQLAAERRAALLTGEVEELRAQLEVLERNRKITDAELHDAADRISEITAQNASLNAAKKKAELDVQTIHADFEERVNEAKVSEDQAKKAMADAARLAEELRQEQDHANQIEKMRRGLEVQLKESQTRLDEAEAAALHGGKKTIQKLEARVRELEAQLEREQHSHTETQKHMRKYERQTNELTQQIDDDRKVQDRMRMAMEKLQDKVKAYKKQLDDTEEIAAINLTKYRKLQHDLEESEARAEMSEDLINQLRTKNRASSLLMENSASQQPISGIKLRTTLRTSSVTRDMKSFDS